MQVAVVGGGASGVLVAARLLDASIAASVVVRVVEPAAGLGSGVAYSTDDPDHLLNVRASGMTADPSCPDDFVRWAVDRGLSGDPNAFHRRRDYRRYLADHLAVAATGAAAGALEHVRATAESLRREGGSWVLGLDHGRPLRADAVVLATGNPPPGVPASLLGLGGASGWVSDPWRRGALELPTEWRRVLLVGTGLTMVDVAVTLARDPGRELVAVSRRGELPRAHVVDQRQRPVAIVSPGGADVDLDTLRARVDERIAEGEDWRDVVDALRPWVNAVWLHLSPADRRRFLTDTARSWDVHRHRMAPQPAATIEELRSSGRLVIRVGEPLDVRPCGSGWVVALTDGTELNIDAVVNCTGPGRPWHPPANPLVAELIATGLARPDPLAIGLDTTVDGRVVDRHGVGRNGLHVVGPPRRGTLWETTAVPEIRSQSLHVADRLLVSRS